MALAFEQPIFILEKGRANFQSHSIYPIKKARPRQKKEIYILCSGHGSPEEAEFASSFFLEKIKLSLSKEIKISHKKSNQTKYQLLFKKLYEQAKEYTSLSNNQTELNCSISILFKQNKTIEIINLGTNALIHFRKELLLNESSIVSSSGHLSSSNNTAPTPSYKCLKSWESNDLFLICSDTLRQTFNQRQLKYLMGQYDGLRDTRELLCQKLKEGALEVSKQSLGGFLVNIPMKKAPVKKAIPFNWKGALISLLILGGLSFLLYSRFTEFGPEAKFEKLYKSGALELLGKEYDSSIEFLEEALEIDHKNDNLKSKALEKLKEAKLYKSIQEGNKQLDRKNFKEAKSTFIKAAKIDSTNSDYLESWSNYKKQVKIKQSSFTKKIDQFILEGETEKALEQTMHLLNLDTAYLPAKERFRLVEELLESDTVQTQISNQAVSNEASIKASSK